MQSHHDGQSVFKTLHLKFVLKDICHLPAEISVPERIGATRNSAEIALTRPRPFAFNSSLASPQLSLLSRGQDGNRCLCLRNLDLLNETRPFSIERGVIRWIASSGWLCLGHHIKTRHDACGIVFCLDLHKQNMSLFPGRRVMTTAEQIMTRWFGVGMCNLDVTEMSFGI
jgi:hypothetical protein